MSSGLFAMNKKVTSLSWVAPCSISKPSGNHTKLPGPNEPVCVFADAVEDVYAVRAVVRMPFVGEAGEVLHLHHRHPGVRVLDERFRREIAVELVNMADLPRHRVGVPATHLTR
jgi:hypothetical protein